MTITELFFELIQVSIGTRVCLSATPTPTQWYELFKLAEKHGLLALCFKGVEKLHPQEQVPPMDLLMDWLGQSSFVETCIDQKTEGLEALRKLYHENGIDIFVMKGLSLCTLYPSPKLRDFGDHDVYTFDKHEQANNLIRDLGIEIDLEDKHDVFDYAGVHIEHHNYFVDEYSKIAGTTNEYLKNLAYDERVGIEEGLYYPSANFNAVYLLYHTIAHLAYEGATLKNILDWGLFLYMKADFVDWNKTKAFYKNVRLSKAFNTITKVASMVTGYDFDSQYIGEPNTKLANRTLNGIFNTSLHSELKYGTLIRIIKKTQRVWSHRWLYSSGLVPTSFWSYVKGSLKEHIEHPNQF